MYDVNQNKSFLIGANPDQSLPLWWDDAEPVWVTAEKMASLFIYTKHAHKHRLNFPYNNCCLLLLRFSHKPEIET